MVENAIVPRCPKTKPMLSNQSENLHARVSTQNKKSTFELKKRITKHKTAESYSNWSVKPPRTKRIMSNRSETLCGQRFDVSWEMQNRAWPEDEIHCLKIVGLGPPDCQPDAGGKPSTWWPPGRPEEKVISTQEKWQESDHRAKLPPSKNKNCFNNAQMCDKKHRQTWCQ